MKSASSRRPRRGCELSSLASFLPFVYLIVLIASEVDLVSPDDSSNHINSIGKELLLFCACIRLHLKFFSDRRAGVFLGGTSELKKHHALNEARAGRGGGGGEEQEGSRLRPQQNVEAKNKKRSHFDNNARLPRAVAEDDEGVNLQGL